jgi:surface polysaccharide O-acyltransferase-like enzyme
MLTTSLIYIISNRYYKIGFDWKRIVLPLIIVISGYFLVHNTNFFEQNELSKKTFILIFTVILIVKYWLSITEKKQVVVFFRKLFS